MQHSLISPSGVHRARVCTKSVRFGQQFEDSSSEYAEEGTLAHELFEILIKYSLGMFTKSHHDHKVAKVTANLLYKKEMMRFMKNYRDFVLEEYNEAKAEGGEATILIEQQYDLSMFWPEGKGFGDVAIVSTNAARFIDLKYGKGVPVSAEDNDQLKCYALGVIEKYHWLWGFDTVKTTIYQPRSVDGISHYEYTVTDLYTWAEEVLKPTMLKAWNDQGTFNPDDKACKFCKGKIRCGALADTNLGLEKYDGRINNYMSDDELVDFMKRSKLLVDQYYTIKRYMEDQAINKGHEYPGYKLIHGRADRYFEDEPQAVKLLRKLGYTDEQIYSKKIAGIPHWEDELDTVDFEKLSKFIKKPPGLPTLVTKDTKGTPYNSSARIIDKFND